jgi:hypothetical protein
MKWKTHKKITLEVCRYFGLEAERIAEASITPDIAPDYALYGNTHRRKRRVKHHGDVLENAYNYLRLARYSYVNGSDYTRVLGRAVHYLQDYAVSSKRGFLFIKFSDDYLHDVKESEVANQPVPFDAISEADKTVCYPHEFISKASRIKPSGDPEVAMYNATYLTALAIKLVIDPDIPDDLDRLRVYRVTGYVFAFLPLLFILKSLFFIPISLVSSYLIYWMNPARNLKKDMDWLNGKID